MTTTWPPPAHTYADVVAAAARDAGPSPRAAVLTELARGLKDAAVARELGISVRTVRRHIAEFMREVGAHNRFEAGALWASMPGNSVSSLGLTPPSRSN